MSFFKFKLYLANFLFKNIYWVYKILYFKFKRKIDAFEIKIIDENTFHGDLVLDIGSNIGFYTILFSKKVGSSGVVYSFEPEPLNFRRLKSFIKNSNVVLTRKAVGMKTGPAYLYKSQELNVDHRTYETNENRSSTLVDLISIDDFCIENKISKIDFIKIDIQGYELNALFGMQNILNENLHVKILSEFWPYGLKMSGYSSAEFYNFFYEMGFSVFLIDKGQLRKLSIETVGNFNDRDDKQYFNVFCYREI